MVVRLSELSADEEARLLYEKRETARRMKAKGYQVKAIIDLTDLSAAVIETL
ncbi:hypothetical protein FACS1894170_10250 [Planctomycetales bacterium]|nr:hypothetical protein FACS1894170_10250 [Planctomycetales bacterium]